MNLDLVFQRARDRVKRIPDVDCAFLSGSLIEGFGNPTSDVDLYVLRPGHAAPVEVDGLSVRFGETDIGVEFDGDVRLDIEFWPTPSVLSVAERVRAVQPDAGTDDLAFTRLTEGDMQLAHRVLVGRPVWEIGRFHEVAGAFDPARLARALTLHALVVYNAHLEDAVGAIQAEDHVTAMITSRLALESALDLLTARLGMTNAKPKWRGSRLRALGRTRELTRYLELETAASVQPRDVLKAARSRLRFATAIVSEQVTP